MTEMRDFVLFDGGVVKWDGDEYTLRARDGRLVHMNKGEELKVSLWNDATGAMYGTMTFECLGARGDGVYALAIREPFARAEALENKP